MGQLNSFASVGKILSPPLIGFTIERFGHRWALFATVMINYLGSKLQPNPSS